MKQEVIYTKKYQKSNKIIIHHSPSSLIASTNKPNFQEFYKKINEEITLIPIPNRKSTVVQFIDLAIQISELYELDIVITEFDSHFSLVYSFDCGGNMKYLKPIFALADNYSFFCGAFDREISISVDYYTHYEIRNNTIVAP